MGGNSEGASDLAKLAPLENLSVGVASGTIEVCLLQPMLYCKNAAQQGLPLTLNPAVLYRGISMSVVNMSILTGVQFPLMGAVSRAVAQGEERKLTGSEQVGAGFIAGALSVFVCAPMELIMIQQQRKGTSLVEATRRIVSERGPLTLFRGLETSCGREGLFTAGYLGMGPVFAEALRKNYDMSTATSNFAGAAGAGMIAATLSHPLDTIKTCMQGDVERATYSDFMGTARTLLQQEGIGRFFNGWAFRTSRMICAIWLIGQCKNVFAPLLFPAALKQKAES